MNTESEKQGHPNGDAVEMLKADHEKVKKLFTEFESASRDEQARVVHQIFQELEIHSTLEEEIFYPAVRDQIDAEDLAELEEDEEEEDDEGDEVESTEEMGEGVIAVAYAEHKAVKELIHELKQMGHASDQFKETFAELREDVLDHVSEEEDVIFPAALLKLDVVGLGAQMQKRKMDLMSAMAGK